MGGDGQEDQGSFFKRCLPPLGEGALFFHPQLSAVGPDMERWEGAVPYTLQSSAVLARDTHSFWGLPLSLTRHWLEGQHLGGDGWQACELHNGSGTDRRMSWSLSVLTWLGCPCRFCMGCGRSCCSVTWMARPKLVVLEPFVPALTARAACVSLARWSLHPGRPVTAAVVVAQSLSTSLWPGTGKNFRVRAERG